MQSREEILSRRRDAEEWQSIHKEKRNEAYGSVLQDRSQADYQGFGIFLAHDIGLDDISANKRRQSNIKKHAGKIHLDKTAITSLHLQRWRQKFANAQRKAIDPPKK